MLHPLTMDYVTPQLAILMQLYSGSDQFDDFGDTFSNNHVLQMFNHDMSCLIDFDQSESCTFFSMH